MAQVINTNVMSLNAQRNLSTNSASLATTIQRLSSGLRINSAKDDAAGLAISQRMTTQVRGMDVAARNANDGISLAQTAEGALSSIGENMQRIRELAVQAANGTNSANDRTALQKEVTQLAAEITRVKDNSNFNGTKLLNGSTTSFTIQVGADAGSDNQISISTVDMTATSTAVAALDISSASGATAALTAIDTQLQSVNTARADLGAIQNRFSSVISNLQTSSENLSAARSRIQGHRLRQGNRGTDPHPDPAAGRYGDAGPGQVGPAERPEPPAVTRSRWRREQAPLRRGLFCAPYRGMELACTGNRFPLKVVAPRPIAPGTPATRRLAPGEEQHSMANSISASGSGLDIPTLVSQLVTAARTPTEKRINTAGTTANAKAVGARPDQERDDHAAGGAGEDVQRRRHARVQGQRAVGGRLHRHRDLQGGGRRLQRRGGPPYHGAEAVVGGPCQGRQGRQRHPLDQLGPGQGRRGQGHPRRRFDAGGDRRGGQQRGRRQGRDRQRGHRR